MWRKIWIVPAPKSSFVWIGFEAQKQKYFGSGGEGVVEKVGTVIPFVEIGKGL